MEHVENKWKNDKEVCKHALKNDGQSIQFMSDQIKDNNELVKIAIKEDPKAIFMASES